MELIILGLLMLKEYTIYEIKKTIEEYFAAMCSSSTGSIQAAVKKLLNNGMITYNEFVENSVNKKMYVITDKGKAYFIDSISKPMYFKEKNIELCKLYFMGFTPKHIRLDLINAYISELKSEREKLEKIRFSSQNTESIIESYIIYLNESGKLVSFKEMLCSESLSESLQDIALFQFATLELGIDKADFEIRWFEQFKKRLEGNNENEKEKD